MYSKVEKYQSRSDSNNRSKIEEDQELILESNPSRLVIMLHTSSKIFRKQYLSEEPQKLPEDFESITQIQEYIQDPQICTVDRELGQLLFKVKVGIGKKQRDRIVRIEMEELKETDYFRLEVLVKRNTRRQFKVEKEVKAQNQEIRQLFQQLQSQMKENLQKVKNNFVEELKAFQEEQKSDKSKIRAEIGEEVEALRWKVQRYFQDSTKNVKEKISEVKEWVMKRDQHKTQSPLEVMKPKIMMEDLEKVKREIQTIREQMELNRNIMNTLLTNIDSTKKELTKKPSEESKPKPKKKKSIFDLTTPHIDLYDIVNPTTIMRKQGEKTTRQILLNTVIDNITSFNVHIHQTKDRNIKVGIVDRVRQKDKDSSFKSGNAVSFSGNKGRIFIAEKNGKYKYNDTCDAFNTDMDIWVEVNLTECWMVFVLKEKKEQRKHLVECPILREIGREFVPYIEMSDPGDCVEVTIY